MSTQERPKVGVVNAPAIADALRHIGFKVITAEDSFKAAATAVSNALNDESFPVVAAEDADPGFRPWVVSTARRHSVVVLGTRPDLHLNLSGTTRLDLPATVDDLLPLLGFQASGTAHGAQLIEPEEAPVVVAASAALPLVPVPVAVVAPVLAPAAAPTLRWAPPTNLFDDDDDDDDDVAAVAAAVTPAIPAPYVEPLAPAVYVAPITPTAPEYVAAVVPIAPVHVQTAPVHMPAAVSPQARAELDAIFFEADAPELTQTISTTHEAEPLPALFFEVPAVMPVAVAVTPAVVATNTLSADFFAAPAPELLAPATPPIYTAPSVPAYKDRPYAPEPQGDLWRSTPRVTETVHAQNDAASPAKRGELVFCVAAKGGVGKTTIATSIAKTASEAGLIVTLIDANRGQPDVTKNLKFQPGSMRTIYDAVRTGNPAQALLLPDEYNSRRPASVDELKFGLVLGPPSQYSSPEATSAAVYAAVTEYARSRSDLVIVDTQISEAYETDLFDRFIIPSMVSGAWSIGIANESIAGVGNLLDRLQVFADRGVRPDRFMVIASMFENFDEEDARAITAKYGRFATFMGSAGADQNIRSQMSVGNFPNNDSSMTPVLRAILHRVTGNPQFAPEAAVETAEPRRGWLSRWKTAGK